MTRPASGGSGSRRRGSASDHARRRGSCGGLVHAGPGARDRRSRPATSGAASRPNRPSRDARIETARAPDFDRRRWSRSETEPESPWAQAMVGQRSGRRISPLPRRDGARRIRRHLARPAAARGPARRGSDLGLRVAPFGAAPAGGTSRRPHPSGGPRPHDRHLLRMACRRRSRSRTSPPVTGSRSRTPPRPPTSNVRQPGSWHEIPALEADWMRRRRLVDVIFDDEHDAQGAGSARFGRCSATRSARPTAPSWSFTSTRVTGRLEWTDDGMVLALRRCRSEGPAVHRVPGRRRRGRRARRASCSATCRGRYPRCSFGVASCTHLNDLLRNIGGMAPVLVSP